MAPGPLLGPGLSGRDPGRDGGSPYLTHVFERSSRAEIRDFVRKNEVDASYEADEGGEGEAIG